MATSSPSQLERSEGETLLAGALRTGYVGRNTSWSSDVLMPCLRRGL